MNSVGTRSEERNLLNLLSVILLGGVLLIIVVASDQAGTPQPKDEGSALREGDKAPALTLKAGDGGSVSLRDFRNQDVLLYFSMGPG
jgi:hypothetical protein